MMKSTWMGIAAAGVFGLVLVACSASDDPDEDGDGGGENGGSAGSPSGGGAGSGGGGSAGGGSAGGGSGTNVCTTAEVAVVQSCIPIYEQMSYPTCSAIAACAKNEARPSISDGCYICLADVATACDISSGTVACPCCVP